MERTGKNAGHEMIENSTAGVHVWRASQLQRLGIPASLAEVHADHLDWHQIARLVGHGCPPLLALRIIS